jgi:uncharacterized DUF497 family protein
VRTFRFESESQKARSNERKHGVSFEEAETVFRDVFALHAYDGDHSWEEDRFIIIGMSERERVLTVVYVERTSVVLRLISARRATLHERKTYEEKNR